MTNCTSENQTDIEYRSKYKGLLPVLIFIFLLPFSVTGQTFEHPGGMYSSSLIEETRQKISEGEEPWVTAYKQLMHQAETSLQRKPEAVKNFNVPGYYRDPKGHHREQIHLSHDAWAAYSCLLY